MKRFVFALLLALLTATPSSAHLWHVVFSDAQTSDSASATPTAIDGLTFPIAASQVALARCHFVSTSSNAGTGIRYAVTGPSSPTAVTITLETWRQNTTDPSTAILLERYS